MFWQNLNTKNEYSHSMSSVWYQPLSDFVYNYWGEIIVAIFATIFMVISEVALYYYFKGREKPKMVITPVSKEGYAFGFTVQMLKKNVINARVRCNNKNCFWVETNGKTAKKDLMAGDEPSIVLPFEATIESTTIDNSWIADRIKVERSIIGQFKRKIVLNNVKVESKEVLVLKIFFEETGEVIFTQPFPIPIIKYLDVLNKITFIAGKGNYGFKVSLRIIGEGIEEKKEYCVNTTLRWINLPVFKEGKPDLDYVSFIFDIHEQKRLRLFSPSYTFEGG